MNHFKFNDQASVVLAVCAFLFLILGGCAEGNSRNPADDENREFGNCEIFFSQTNYCANLIWHQVPADDNDGGSFYLEFVEQTNPSVPTAPPGAPSVSVHMPASEEPAESVFVEAKNFSQYFVPRAHINARGSWEILVQLRTVRGVVDQGVYKYNRL